jgi:hypothetical protein
VHLDCPAGDVHKLDLGVLGGVDQEGKRLLTGNAVAVHQDPLGLTDDIASGDRVAELIVARRTGQRERGVLSEQCPTIWESVVNTPAAEP